MKLKQIRDDTGGGVLVEVTLTLPLFLVLMFGLIQAGLLLCTYSGLQHGVEMAARCASVNYSAYQMGLTTSCFGVVPSTVIANTNNTQIKQYAIDHSFGLVDLATFTVTFTKPPGGGTVCPTNIGYQVTATAPFNLINYIFSLTLTATSKFPINCS